MWRSGRVAPSLPRNFSTSDYIIMSRYNFFIHPSNLQKMDAVLKMRMTEGSSGYGIYIMLLELLRDSDDLKTAYDPAVLAWALHESDQDRLRRVCEEYELFEISEKREISCPWLTEIMAEHTERKAKLAEAGRKSAELRKQRANLAETTLNNMGGGSSNKADSASQQTTTDKNTVEKNTETKSFADLVADGNVFSEESIRAIGRSHDQPFCISVETLTSMSDDRHNLNVIGDIARDYKMNVTQFAALRIATNNALIGSPELMALIAAKNNCRDTKFCPKYPFEYFISKIKDAHGR